VYNERDCTGIAETVEMNDVISANCMGNMRVSCQESPVAVVEEW
jgi:hypothetical protein